MHRNHNALYLSLEKNVDELKASVAKHKREKQALRDSAERNRLLAEQSIQGIALRCGLPPAIVYVNPTWPRIFGDTSEPKASGQMSAICGFLMKRHRLPALSRSALAWRRQVPMCPFPVKI